ncbi:hypothetical protein B4N89_46870 [Embleya scabrispora]|uniref:Uncharacterized protein n=1 Tax=Embleya scabrispora TaxID=159449 RepID=A0A1T3NI61_9ACTN|nr:hypothetical protein [Embleya scabrispora]OPC76537.1 hypothetical protein B4N89_46870 [Embleya scabrispora]
MLSESLTALAAMGGSAVVQAVGTDAWASFRVGVGRLFGRGGADEQAARVTLERLDRVAVALENAPDATDAERVGAETASAWRTRFEDLLDGLPEHERRAVETELRELVEAARRAGAAAGGHSAGHHGAVVRGDLNITAEGGSAAAFGMGDVHLGAAPGPSVPGPLEG